MQFLFAALVVAIACAGWGSTDLAHAQRVRVPGQSVSNAESTVQFRARTTDERLASANRLGGQAQPGVRGAPVPPTIGQLGETITVTPRNPYVDNHVSLWAINLTSSPSGQPNSGVFFFWGGTSVPRTAAVLDVRLVEPKRLLIECTVASDGSIAASVYLLNLDLVWSGTSSVSGQDMISYLTPVLPSGLLHVELAPQVVSTTPPWNLFGCEVTEVSP